MRVIEAIKGVKGWVFYFFNPRHLECEIRPLMRLDPDVTIKDTQERFLLGKAAFFLNGLPAWIVVRDNPHSITLRLLRHTLEEIGVPPSELHKKLTSAYFRTLFGQRTISLNIIFYIICAVVITALVTFTICNALMGGIPSPEPTETITETTEEVVEAIWRLTNYGKTNL